MAKHGGRKRIPLPLGTSKAKRVEEKEAAELVASHRRITRWIIGGAVVFLLALVLLTIRTCRSGIPPGPPTSDDAQVRLQVGQITNAARSPAGFKEYFATSATVPSEADRQRYRKLLFDAVARPSVSGDTATVQVRVRDDDNPKPLGEVEWTFVKEGDRWKAKTTPLP